MSEPSDGNGLNEPWLDMSAYPSLPPDDAVDADLLDLLHAMLRAPELTPLRPDAWSRALHEAVTGGPAGHDHDPAADGSPGPQTGPGSPGPEGEHGDPAHDDPARDDPAHEGGWGSGWPGGHDGVSGYGDWPGQHDSGDGGGHW